MKEKKQYSSWGGILLYFAVNLCRRQATAAVSTDTHSIIGFAAAVHNIFTEIGY